MSRSRRTGPRFRDPDPSTELVARIASGDRAAFVAFYDAMAPHVFGLARRVLSSRVRAEEAVADAMVEMWRTAARYDPARGSVRSWASTITLRCAGNRYQAH